MKEINKSFKSKNSKFIFIIFTSYFVFSSMVCTSGSKVAINQIVKLELVKILSKEKQDAESYAKELKLYYSSNKQEYKKGLELYGTARSEYNAWIDQFVFDIRYDRLKSSDIYSSQIEEAAEKASIFKNYVKDLKIPGIKIEKIPFNLGATIIQFGRAIIEISSEIKKADAEKKEKIIKDLEAYKWKAFENI